jgi:surface polysaccharide O-acyltransferase-like enzyme
MRKERNSSVELLKVITIFLIVISHSLPVYGTGDP